MKLLKIRTWDKEIKEMKVWDFRDVWESELMPDFDDYDLMQFTGLLDKEGKEIYEGDIIRFHSKEHAKKPVAVRWDRCMGVSGWYTNNCSGIPQDKDSNPIMVIIGNIYENPELLNEG